MDIRQLVVTSASQEEEKDNSVEMRDILYKRKGINFSSSNKENRALRQIRVQERRKSSRLVQQSAARNISSEDEAGDSFDENEKTRTVKSRTERKGNATSNLINKVSNRTVFPAVTQNTKEARSKSRREKLAEYLVEKKKLEEFKRRSAKPAFKVGVVRHGLAPSGAFSTIIHKSTMNSTKMSMLKISNMTRGPNMAKLSSKSCPQKVKNASKTTPATIQVDPHVDHFPNNLSKPLKSVPPPAKSPIPSFAPENYKFEMKIPVKSDKPEEQLEAAAQSTHNQDKMTSIKLSNIADVENVKIASVSEMNDDVFTDVVSGGAVAEESTENTTHIDREILASVYKNKSAKKLANNKSKASMEEDIAPVRLLDTKTNKQTCATPPVAPARYKVLLDNSPEQDGLSRPSTGGLEDCSLSPIKLQQSTPLKNIHTPVINNNFLTNLATEDHDKSFSSLNCNTPHSEPVFKTPIRPDDRSAIKVKKCEAVSPWITTTQGSCGSLKRNKRGSICEDRQQNRLSTVLGNDVDCTHIKTSFVRRIKSIEDLTKAKEEATNSNSKESCEASASVDLSYFREILVTEFRRLTAMCYVWDKKLQLNGFLMSEDIQGEILSVCGQARLIMAERFPQFSGLVDNCEYKIGVRETKCSDLKGFWDMVYCQVEDVDKKFIRLSVIESNNWVEENPFLVRRNPLRKARVLGSTKDQVKSTSGLVAMIAARRKEMSEGGDRSGVSGVDIVNNRSDV